MPGQEVLEGTAGEGAKLRLSFAGMQVIADREPQFQDPIYLIIGGHLSQLKEAPGDEPAFVLATVKGQGHIITKDQFYALANGRPAPMWDDNEKQATEREADE